MPDRTQEERQNVEERWPHMSTTQKLLLFGGVCVYAVLTGYGPLLLGWEEGVWGRAAIETLTYVLIGAALIWIVFPSVTGWVQDGAEQG